MRRVPQRTLRLRVMATIGLTLAMSSPLTAYAVSSWNPTLLVNTESFQTIDEGDGTTNIQIKFGQTLLQTLTYDRTNARFQFSRGLSVLGTMSGSNLNVDHNATIGGALTASGNIVGLGTITAKTTLSGSNLNISHNATFGGAITATGNILTFGTLISKSTISGSNLNVSHNVTIGGALTATGAIKTKGNLSGSSLNVDGTINWHGISYTGPTSQSNGTFLKTDGNGNLTWATPATTVSSGSGNILAMQPEYPNAVYFASGSLAVGQLSASGGTAGRENIYRWTSTKTARNNYWIGVRVRVPDNFVSWINTTARKPIELRYRTGSGQLTGTSTGSVVNIKMTDTTGAAVTLTGGRNLANTSYTTASITGPDSAGTFAKGGYFNIWIKLDSSTTPNGNWFSEVGFLNLDWLTSTP